MSDGVAGFEMDMVSISAGHDAVNDFKEELVAAIQKQKKKTYVIYGYINGWNDAINMFLDLVGAEQNEF